MNTMIFFLSFSFMLIGSISGEDMDECNKIVKTMSCCRPPKEPSNAEELAQDILGSLKERNDKYETCMKELKDGPNATTLEEALGPLECLSECTLNGTKLMTPDFKLNKEIVLKVVENDPEWKEFLQKRMDICEEKIAKLESVSPKCKGNIVRFAMCMIEEVVNNCPVGGPMAGSADCKERNLSIKKCNPLNVINM